MTSVEGEHVNNPDSNICDFYLARKRRFCKTAKKPNCRYCHTHQAELHPESCEDDRRRVPCPVNPNHTVYEKDVAKHVLVCPDRRHEPQALPYWEENCHARKGLSYLSESELTTICAAPVTEAMSDDQTASEALQEGVVTSSLRFTHRDLPPAELDALCRKVLALYEKEIHPLIHVSHAAEVASDGAQRVNRKHSTQHVALTRILLDRLAPCSVPDARNVFVELGAGKGGLAYALAEEMHTKRIVTDDTPAEPSEGVDVVPGNAPVAPLWVVVDIGGFRRKRDGCVRNTDHQFHRLRINIKDLSLSRVPLLTTPPMVPNQHFVGLGKHLCGSCTDFALSCITTKLPQGGRCDALLLATCCHHLCELQHLNPITTTNILGGDVRGGVTWKGVSFTTHEFCSVVSMTSWAVCGAHKVSSERQHIGYACKRLIDALRVEHLKTVCGFEHVELHEYAPQDITGENVCIVAWRGHS